MERRKHSPPAESVVDGRVECADDEQREEEVEGARDEVVVRVRRVHVHLAEVHVAQVRQRLQAGVQEHGAHEGRADAGQQHGDAEGLAREGVR